MDQATNRSALTPVIAACVTWDYSPLAGSYDLRADYSASLVAEILGSIAVRTGDRALDVGAGTGKLAVLLRQWGVSVTAIEPSAAMRAVGEAKPALAGMGWIAARAEALPIGSRTMQLVSFGSSFNVVEERAALDECARVLVPGGHWLALWNHRDLDDPLQREIERVLRWHLPGFDYGSRRSSPAPQIEAHGRFKDVLHYERRFVADIPATDWLQAWQSHATLRRQAGDQLPAVLAGIRAAVGECERLAIPYFTRAWTAQRR